MSSYFMNVLDVAIFELYFPEKLEKNKLSALLELKTLPPLETGIDQIKEYYNRLNFSNSPVKKAVYSINAIPDFKLIYEILSHEN